MKATSQVYKKALIFLKKSILAIFGSLAGYVLIYHRDLINIKLLKLVQPAHLLIIAELLLLLILVVSAYVLLSYLKSKKEMKELKEFLDRYVYSRYDIHNPFVDEASHSVEEHLRMETIL